VLSHAAAPSGQPAGAIPVCSASLDQRFAPASADNTHITASLGGR